MNKVYFIDRQWKSSHFSHLENNFCYDINTNGDVIALLKIPSNGMV